MFGTAAGKQCSFRNIVIPLTKYRCIGEPRGSLVDFSSSLAYLKYTRRRALISLGQFTVSYTGCSGGGG